MFAPNSEVLALNHTDGCMYTGRVTELVDEKNALVRFRYSLETHEIPNNLCLPVKGSVFSCPLELGDSVLVRVRNTETGQQCWVPAHVAGKPRPPSDCCHPLSQNYPIQLFSGIRKLFRRRDILKISSQLHDELTRRIFNAHVDEDGSPKEIVYPKPKPLELPMPRRRKVAAKPPVSQDQANKQPASVALARTKSKVASASKSSLPHGSRRNSPHKSNPKRPRGGTPPSRHVNAHLLKQYASGTSKRAKGHSTKHKAFLHEKVNSPGGNITPPLGRGDKAGRTVHGVKGKNMYPKFRQGMDFGADNDDLGEWDKTQPVVLFTPSATEEGETEALREDAKVKLELPGTQCRLSVSASVNAAGEVSSNPRGSKYVAVTLDLKGRKGSTRRTINLDLPGDEYQSSGAHSLAEIGKDGRGKSRDTSLRFADELNCFCDCDDECMASDDFDWGRKSKPSWLVEDVSTKGRLSQNQPIKVCTSMDLIPSEQRVVETSFLLHKIAPSPQEVRSSESHSASPKTSTFLSEIVSMGSSRGRASAYDRRSKLSSTVATASCQPVEKHSSTAATNVASHSNEQNLVVPWEALEHTDQMHLAFVEALRVTITAKADARTHGGRASFGRRGKVNVTVAVPRAPPQAGNNSSTSWRRKKSAIHECARIVSSSRRLATQQSTAHPIAKSEDKDEGADDNDLERRQPITALGVSDLERRIHPAVLTRRRYRTRALL